jgi:flagellar biosynthesis protein FlhB
MPSDDKTERATPRRKQKAREQGRVARSRDVGGALICFAAVAAVSWISERELSSWRLSWSRWMDSAWQSDFALDCPLLTWMGITTVRWIVVPAGVTWVLAAVSNVMQGGLVFSSDALVPNLDRLSPPRKLEQLFSLTGLAPFFKSMLPVSVLFYLSFWVVARDWTLLIGSGQMPVRVLGPFLYQRVFEICWKAVLVLLVWSGIDYVLQRHKLERDLRMTKQEVREEFKETDGNPVIKARVRQLQRQMRRRRMLKEVQHATVVVTNPTHFAVALQYQPEMAVPIVTAKGANALAQKIKQLALWHEIPVIESPALAQNLYRTVEVGQAIPAKLYVAVAEILAFIYRARMRADRVKDL